MSVLDHLNAILASNYVLYTKTQHFHWNVIGPHFQTLHEMFEQQYTELASANDELAERIRALGSFAPGTHEKFNTLSFLNEQPENPDATAMVRELLSDHETMITKLRATVQLANDSQDEGTADMLTARMEVHEKTAWMLRSFLG